MTALSLKDRMAALEEENRKLREQSERSSVIRFKVGEKGGVSMYGLGRFPVTLYVEQWQRLLDSTDALRDFIRENDSKLKRKD